MCDVQELCMRGYRWWGAREVERARAGREGGKVLLYLRVARGRRLCPEGDELVGSALGVRRDQHVVLRLGL